MSHLIEAMREGDRAGPVRGIHGALIIAQMSAEAGAELKAFMSGLQTGQMEKGMRFLFLRGPAWWRTKPDGYVTVKTKLTALCALNPTMGEPRSAAPGTLA